MGNRIRILSTTSLERSLIRKAMNVGIDIEAIDFISTFSLVDNNLEEQIKNILKNNCVIVFTSANAVREVGIYNESNSDIKIFCIGNNTKKTVEKYFDNSQINGWANDAEELANEIVKHGWKKVTFFCGDKRLNTLPAILENEGVEVEDIVVYQTVETPVKVQDGHDAVLFFSPSCVHSFFTLNTLSHNAVCFAIGRTTANTLKEKTNNKVVTSPEPTKQQVVGDTISYFRNNS